MATPPSYSRRAILQSSAAVASAPLIGGCATLTTGAAAPAGDSHPLRIGLIGCGGRGTGAAYQALMAEGGGGVLYAVGDVFPDRIESSLAYLDQALAPTEADPDSGTEALPDRRARLQVAPDRRFVGFGAYENVIEEVDVVLLATPPVFRPQHLRAAVEADKHVFCEKPFAVDAHGVRSALETSALAERKQLSLVAGFCWRYNIRHRAFYERLQAGALGELRAFYSTYNAGPPRVFPPEPGWSEMEWQIRNWKSVQWLSGDHITEQAVHSLDKMAWAFADQPPISVVAIGGRQARGGPENGNIFDHFGATFDYGDGRQGFHMSRQMDGCAFENNDYFQGENGHARIEGWTPLHQMVAEETWTYDGPGNDMYQQEHDELFASIRSGKPRNDGVWAAQSSMLAVMTRMSAYTGQSVTWEEAMSSDDRMSRDAYAMTASPMRPVPIPGKPASHPSRSA